VGSGVEPGMSDVLARYAEKHFFDEIEEIGIRDGNNLEVKGVDIAFGFSIWTTIEECLNPPVILEKDKGWYTTEPFSQPEVFRLPEGIGEVEMVNVEHEEVLLIPRYIDKGLKRVTFKFGLGNEFIQALKYLQVLNMDRKDMAVDVGGPYHYPQGFFWQSSSRPYKNRTSDDRQNLCRDMVQRKEKGSSTTDLSLPGRRQSGLYGKVRLSGGCGPDGIQSCYHDGTFS